MDPKGLAELVKEAETELHKKYDQAMEETKKLGAPMAETTATLTKLNTRIDELEVKLQRQSIPGAGEDPEQKTEESKARSAAFYKWVRGGAVALTPDERKALVEDATGQYLITPDLDAEIVRTLPKITVVRPLATVRTIGKDRIKMRSLSEVSVGWGKLETGTDITETDMTPGAPTYQYVEDLYALAKIGEDELMDSDTNLEPILADSFARAIGEEEDKQFMIGDGHASAEPEGITINATLITNTVTGTAAGAVTFEKFLEMIYACPPQYRKNGVFIVNSTLELALRQIRATTYDATHYGAFIWQPSVQAGRPNTLLGHPVYTQDDMCDLSDAASVIAVFGDVKSGYRIIDRQGMTLQRLTELYSEAGLVGFKVHKRVGASVMKASQKPLVLLTEHA